MLKKISKILLVFAICFAVVGCNKNPSSSSQYSSEIIVEEVIVEEIITESKVESAPSESVVPDNSSQPTPSQPTPSQPTPPQETKNVIPEGGTYKVYRTGDTLIAGQEFPQTSEVNDVYTYGDYKYRYDNTIAGWRVKVLDKTKSRYGKILDSINGKAIKSMGGTSLTPQISLKNVSAKQHFYVVLHL